MTAFITTEVKSLTSEEEAAINALAERLAATKPNRILDESHLTTEQIFKIRRACIQGHSAKAIQKAFNVSLAYVLKVKRNHNPKKYQKTPLTLAEKGVMAKQMEADGLSLSKMAELLGINSKMVSLLLTQPSPRYLVEQMLPYDQVLQNLRSARYVENPVYKEGTNKRRVRLIVSEARQQTRQVITKTRELCLTQPNGA